MPRDYSKEIKQAVRHFWIARSDQTARQGLGSGIRDAGARGAVTGGKQMDGFVRLIRDLLVECGIPATSLHCERWIELPGYFRPEKKWDLLVVIGGNVVAAVEFKSQVGPSFGNNFNNRGEEAIGNATDLWTAYREGAFPLSRRPWLGYLMLLEEDPRSLAPVGVREPHFKVFPEFRDSSYAKRYELMILRLVRERLYDAGCLILSKQSARAGAFREPCADLAFERFASSLLAQATAFRQLER